jgi:hypothetical protein
MGRVLRLIVAILVLFGIWRAASAEMDQMKFEEAVKHVATFSAEQDEYTVREALMKEARALSLPVEPSLVFVRKDSDRIHIELTYIRTIRLLPFVSTDWPFAVKVDSSYILGGRIR